MSEVEHRKIKFHQVERYKRFTHNGVYFVKLTNTLAVNISNGAVLTMEPDISCRIAYDKKLNISKV